MKNKEEKLNRIEESRYFETRSYEEMDDDIRRNIQQSWRDPHYIDPRIVPEGMVYGFKRQYVDKFGYEDKARIPECMAKGWRPVPAERHPELVSVDPSGRNTHVKGYIERGGLILMERPKKYNDMEIEVITRTTHEQLNSHEALRGNAPYLNVTRNSMGYGPLDGSY